MTRRSHLDLLLMAAAALVPAIGAGALTTWVTTVKIARRLVELAARAKAFAPEYAALRDSTTPPTSSIAPSPRSRPRPAQSELKRARGAR